MDDTPTHEPATGRRWPGFVYGDGVEPDYRFTFANERTYLAWIRTALALLAAGVALDVVELDLPGAAQEATALALVALGAVGSVLAWVRWALAERAMRRRAPLPSFAASAVLALALVAVAVVAAVAVLRAS
ncbi:DUF202 domain-containing protein [Nocardioides seonyuensis]|uniref:DUF202 domain-containing protein n=1 Tax=Nocardioides seonyuensis TaxID=2518371 RepID=A0A4V1BMG1_9ACTN|nr:DUF202 domain-containing protein [Nocardioides seonyuensis]QBX56252.1 DUF202 domain-containing protein [Nocardioides seonyuensis]